MTRSGCTRRPGPAIDGARLSPAARERFLRDRRTILAVLEGHPLAQVAREHGLAHWRLSVLVRRAQEVGELGLVPHGVHSRSSRGETQMHLAFAEAIHRLYTAPLRPSARAIHEAPQLRPLAARLASQGVTDPHPPSYAQVRRLLRTLDREPVVREARSRLAQQPRADLDWRLDEDVARLAPTVLMPEVTDTLVVGCAEGTFVLLHHPADGDHRGAGQAGRILLQEAEHAVETFLRAEGAGLEVARYLPVHRLPHGAATKLRGPRPPRRGPRTSAREWSPGSHSAGTRRWGSSRRDRRPYAA